MALGLEHWVCSQPALSSKLIKDIGGDRESIQPQSLLCFIKTRAGRGTLPPPQIKINRAEVKLVLNSSLPS